MYFKTEHLAVGYHGKILIDDINVGIEKGNILCLLGPNGSGKSTILKSITKHLSTIDGSVYIDDQDIKRLNGKETAKKISVVLTDRISPDLMTCREIVATGRYPYTNHFGKLTEEDNCIIDNSLKIVSAYELKDLEFNTLSDGQKQRVMLARAICQQPEVIVLDEPTSYLDIRYKLELLSILRKMAVEQGITVVLSLHEVDLAIKLADIIILVKDNKIAKCGFPEDILDDKTIRELYDIESGSFNMLLGSIELKGTSNESKVFVLGGSGSGTLCYRALHKKGINFTTGILHENDIDFYVASGLDANVISVDSFSYIDINTFNEAREAIENSKSVIDSGFTIGELNKENIELLRYASELNKPILSLRKNPLNIDVNMRYYKDIYSLINSSEII
ncbi:MAG: ABC transporter ATP-binding protein [Clostridium sp.]|uniref:ABC transporter ATP-binding protein n=1 Tax=Clostridium sp. TaxID=1506 RepID=UPI002A84F591|nr:ABC transporter ATP-binding protein [Clostridium sp.]MDY5098481.1 ABC transporter ATP-binding protein [Clostridium sp.]